MLFRSARVGLSLRPRHPSARSISADPQQTLAREATFNTLLEHWFPLTYALNSLNRGIGLTDMYPFVLSTPALQKLRFVHEVIAMRSATDVASSFGKEVSQSAS